MSYNKIVAFDTSIITANGGDNIIMSCCNEILEEIFEESFIVHISSHDKMNKFAKQNCLDAEFKIMCGTNILASRMPKFRMWEAGIRDIKYIKDVCLLGAGWREYENEPNCYTKYFWEKVLNKELIHSVRDSYTEEKLKKLGFENVVNTSCPTMWRLTPEHCGQIPTKKSNNVLTTLTDYRRNIKDDRQMLDTLRNNYDKVYLWIQSLEDYNYLKSFYEIQELIIVNPALKYLDEVLERDDIEYCGTRLHAGIRALDHKKRTTIIAKDNRALEIGKDTGLNVIKSEELDSLESKINSNFETKLSLPWENIETWKNQFKK